MGNADKELTAIKFTLEKFQPYLFGCPFIIKTDYTLLKHITMQSKLNQQQLYTLELLQDYNYTIEYLSGAQNAVADALSHKQLLEEQEDQILEVVQVHAIIQLEENHALQQ